jgi:hypothetical protein
MVISVSKWILTGCDINKDIETDGLTQLTLPSMQMPLVENAIRAYVKVLGDKTYWRFKVLTSNEPIPPALGKISNGEGLDEDV